MKRFAILLFLFIGPVLISGLVGCTDCGSDSGPIRYQLDNYEFHAQKLSTSQASPLPVKPVANGDTLSANELELVLVGKTTRLSYHDVGGGSSVFACDPAVIPLDNINRLRLTSNQRFSADLPAGSDLTSVVGIGKASSRRIALADYFALTAEPALDYYLFTLLKSPDRVATHRFTITVELSTGKVLSDTTESIVLKP